MSFQVYPDGNDKLYLFKCEPVPDLVELGPVSVGFPVPFRQLEDGKIFIDDTNPIIFGSIEEAVETIRNNFDEYYKRFSKFIEQKQRNHDEACEVVRNRFGGILASSDAIMMYRGEDGVCECTPSEGATPESHQYNVVLSVDRIENLCTLSINGVVIDAQINLMLVDKERIYVEAKDVTPDSDFVDFFRLPLAVNRKILFDERIKPIIIA